MDETKDILFEIKEFNDTTGEIEGYGSISDDEPDAYNDIISKGAFKETIKAGGRNKTGIPMLWNHNASEPIGKWHSLKEDNVGLYVKGKIIPDIQRGHDTIILIKNKIVTGLSIGYDVMDYKYQKINDKNVRNLMKLNLWEVSPVTFPAKVSANIVGIKSIEAAKSVRELEESLREAGFSRQAASLFILKFKNFQREAGDGDPNLREADSFNQLLNELKTVNDNLKK